MGRPAKEGESPVCEIAMHAESYDPEYRRARETRREAGGTTLQGSILSHDR